MERPVRRGGYKFYWSGGDKGMGGVGIMVAKEWVSSVIEVKRVSDRMMVIRMSVGKGVLNVVSVYGPQSGRPMVEKEDFYSELRKILLGVGAAEKVVLCGDFNGHVGEKAEGFEGVHGGKGFGSRNLEGEMLLEFADSMSLVITNTWFDKEEAQKVSYESDIGVGRICRTVVDYVLVRKGE